jgi:hypothetical protein
MDETKNLNTEQKNKNKAENLVYDCIYIMVEDMQNAATPDLMNDETMF